MFTHSSQAALIAVSKHIHFTCELTPSGMCMGPLKESYTCVNPPPPGAMTCKIAGMQLLEVQQGISPMASEWSALGYLVLIFLVQRVLHLIVLYRPFEALFRPWNKTESSGRRHTRKMRRYSSSLRSSVLKAISIPTRTVKSVAVRPYSVPDIERIGVGAAVGMPELKASTEYVLVWRRLSVVLRSNQKPILDSVTGMAKSGRLLAIMGPSGSGKTTLIHALSNRVSCGTVTGDIVFSGRRPTAGDIVVVPKVRMM